MPIPNVYQTHTQFGRHVVDFELTNELISKQFENMPSVVVCGGFIASDKETGHTTNLGRGGSDYTAAILAAQLNASILKYGRM